jgi:hypothetical protein
MNEYDLPIKLKICCALFFAKGAFGMLVSIIVWFIFDISLTSGIVLFLFLVGYAVFNIEIGKG